MQQEYGTTQITTTVLFCTHSNITILVHFDDVTVTVVVGAFIVIKFYRKFKVRPRLVNICDLRLADSCSLFLSCSYTESTCSLEGWNTSPPKINKNK